MVSVIKQYQSSIVGISTFTAISFMRTAGITSSLLMSRLAISLLPVSRCCEIIQYLEGKDLEKMDWAQIEHLWRLVSPAVPTLRIHPMLRVEAIKAVMQHSIWNPLSVARFTSHRKPDYIPVAAISSHPLIATLITERLISEERLDSISLERALQLVEGRKAAKA